MFSIVVTYYKGKQYIKSLSNTLNNIAQSYYSYAHEKIEVIIVNDSPSDKSINTINLLKEINLTIINNKTNLGIHQSRINGIEYASGEYIIILDQDDELIDSILIEYSKIINLEKNIDLIVSNGWFEDENNIKHLLYANKNDLRIAINPKNHYLIRNFITSPGQCLIKRKAIPDEWKKNVMKNNGCDDTFLWLLMFNDNVKVYGNQNPMYIHKYVGNNTMLDKEKMYKSKLEMIDILSKVNNFNKNNLRKIQCAASYKYKYKKHFLIQSCLHPYIFYYNAKYRLHWKGYILR